MRMEITPPMYERPPRRDSSAVAFLSFGDANTRLRAYVENMSASGAAIRVDSNHDVQTLRDGMMRSRGRVLLIFTTEKTCVEADIVWNKEGRVGLRFRHSFEPYTGRL